MGQDMDALLIVSGIVASAIAWVWLDHCRARSLGMGIAAGSGKVLP